MPDEGVLQGRNDLVNSFTIQQLCFDHGSADVRPLYLVKMWSLRRAACKSLTSRELMRITHLSIHFFLRRFREIDGWLKISRIFISGSLFPFFFLFFFLNGKMEIVIFEMFLIEQTIMLQIYILCNY